MINTTSNYKNPPAKPPYFRCKEVPMRELLLNAGYSGSVSVEEGNSNDFPSIGMNAGSRSISSLNLDIQNNNFDHVDNNEIPLTDADIDNILGSGYSHSRTRNHPELCSPMEPVFKALSECYNMIEYERIVDPDIIQKSDKFNVVHTETGEVRQTLVKPILPHYATSDRFGRQSMNLLEKVDRPKGRPKSPSMINLNGIAGSAGTASESGLNSPMSPNRSVPGSPATKTRSASFGPGSPAASRPGSRPGPDKTSRNYKGSAGTNTQKPRVLVWSHLGLDRAATIVIAYLIRRWNISLEQSIQFIKRNRPGITISPFHMRVLRIWEKKFLCGNYVCMDCLVSSGGVTNAEYAATRTLDNDKKLITDTSSNGTDTDANVVVVVNNSLNKTSAGLSMSPMKMQMQNVNTSNSSSPMGHGDGAGTCMEIVQTGGKTDGEDMNTSTNLAQVKYNFVEQAYKAFNKINGNSHLGMKLGEVREFIYGVRCEHNASTLAQNVRGFGGDGATTTTQENLLQTSIYSSSNISNLCDINLSGRSLIDEDIECLMEILLNIKIITHIRTLELQHNQIGDKGIKTIVSSFIIPEACFNEEIQLMSLNISSNRITNIGAEYIATFLKYNSSVISINMSDNQLHDSGGALIMSILGAQDTDYVDGGKQETFDDEKNELSAVENAILRRKTSLDSHKSVTAHGRKTSLNSENSKPMFSRQQSQLEKYEETSNTPYSGMLSAIEFIVEDSNSNMNEFNDNGSDCGSTTSTTSIGRNIDNSNNKNKNAYSRSTNLLKFKILPQLSIHRTRMNSQASIPSHNSDVNLHVIQGTALDLARRDLESKSNNHFYIPNSNSKIIVEPPLVTYNRSITDLNVSNNDLGEDTAESIIEMLKSNQTLVKLVLDVTSDFTTRNWKYIFDSMRLYNTSLKTISFSDSCISVKSFAHLTKINASKLCTISSINYSRCNLLPGHMKLLVTSPCCTLLDNKNLLKIDFSGNIKIMNEGILYLAASLRGGADSELQGNNKNMRKSKMLLLDDDSKLNNSKNKRGRKKHELNEDSDEEKENNITGGGGSGVLLDHGEGIHYSGDNGSLSAAALQEQYNQSKSGSMIEYYDRNNVISSVQFSKNNSKDLCSLLYLDISCCGIIFYGTNVTKSSATGTSRANLRSNVGFPVGSGAAVATAQSRNTVITNEENNSTFCLGILLDSIKNYCKSLQYLDLSTNNLNNCFGGSISAASRKESRMKKSRGKSAQSVRNVSFAQEVGDVCDEHSMISDINSTTGSVTNIINTPNLVADKSGINLGEAGFVDSFVDENYDDFDEADGDAEGDGAYFSKLLPETMNDNCLESLTCLNLQVLKLNDCKLTALSINKLLVALCDHHAIHVVPEELTMPHIPVSATTVGMDDMTVDGSNINKTHNIVHSNVSLHHSLKALYINKNNINDSVCEPLTLLLQSNFVLQELDLRYNQIGGLCMSKAMSVLKITSKSSNAMKYLNMNIELGGNPCDYSNTRDTININKPSFSAQLSDNKSVSAAYEDVSTGFNVARGDVITIPLPHLARSKQTLKYSYHMNTNTTTPVVTTTSTNNTYQDDTKKENHGIEVIETHVLSTMDHVPIHARKHFAIRKHYADMYNKENPDII